MFVIKKYARKINHVFGNLFNFHWNVFAGPDSAKRTSKEEYDLVVNYLSRVSEGENQMKAPDHIL